MSMAAFSSPQHIMVCAAHMWGHTRALAILTARMVKLRSVTITFYVAAKLYDRTKAEIAGDTSPDDSDLLKRIRLVRIEQGDELIDPAVYRDGVLQTWDKLRNGHSIDCETVCSTPYALNLRVEPVSAFVIDGFTVEIFNVLFAQREAALIPATLKLYVWAPVSMAYFLAVHRKDVLPLVEEMAAREGISANDAAHAVFAQPKGRLIHCPGLPPMYDYELEPQALPFPPELCSRIWIQVGRMLQQTDGLITMDAATYNPAVTSAMREWFAETGRKVYYAGPLITSAQQPCSPSLFVGEDSADIKAFLDRQLAHRGENSVLLISFGSMFWPMDSTKLFAVLTVLIEQKVSFLMTRPSPYAQISDEILAKLQAYEDAFIANWIPQLAVLEHPATGWCLTHGGHNSVLESIYAGVPMIVWPVAADQEPNAVHLTDNLGIAYELLEVRLGAALGPIFRTGRKITGTVDAVVQEFRDVLARAFGPDGEAKRVRLQAVRERLRDAWADGGEGDDARGIARREVESFLDTVTCLDSSAPRVPSDQVVHSVEELGSSTHTRAVSFE
ncbi:UDP-Glycosyltransferase/glycogen phosphorylase [Cubamyces lactineus]|nr:UDP-Glycosyltransferase/glycogen phosphorylase [Cubamyces lactineus]